MTRGSLAAQHAHPVPASAPLDSLKLQSCEASVDRDKTVSLRSTQSMCLLWQLLVVGGGILGSASMPTRTQAVLGVLDEAHTSEQPSFGVGFDLTASYGQDMRPLVEELGG